MSLRPRQQGGVPAKAPPWWRSGRRTGGGLLALVALLYAPFLGRGFTSEDFLLLRVLRQRPPWADLPALFTEPWLGIEVVRFYRPVGELLLALEARWFAGEPLPYNLVHAALHAVNVLLVWRIAVRLAGSGDPADSSAVTETAAAHSGATHGVARHAVATHAVANHRAAAVAAVLFAVHPLHPNAVSWIASYATLFATTLLLAAWWAWEGLRRHPRQVWRWGALLACYAGALGCYEAAVMLPAALALREALLPSPRADRRRRLLLTAVPGLLAAGYLLLRHRVLGAAVGGYTSFTEDLLGGGLARLALDALTSLRRAVHPVYAPGWPAAVAWLVFGVAFLLPAAFALRQHRDAAQGAADGAGGGARGVGPVGSLGWWAFGWGWALLFLAPFAFRPFVPANGRFVYLASVGLALSLAPLAARVSSAPRWRRAGRAGLAVVAIIALHWVVLFFVHAADMGRAGELAETVRDELLSVSRPAGGAVANAPILVAEHPLFVLGPGGTPRAQVLRYGLSDALGPPFVETADDPAAPPHPPSVYPLPVYPRPGAAAASAAAAFAAAGTPVTVLAWDGKAGTFRSPARAPVPGSVPAAVPGAVVSELSAGGTRVTARPVPGAARHRLLVLTRGNPSVTDLAPALGGRLAVAAPLSFIRSMTHLYGDAGTAGPSGASDPVWWWVEATGPAGELLAVSPARTWPWPSGEAD